MGVQVLFFIKVNPTMARLFDLGPFLPNSGQEFVRFLASMPKKAAPEVLYF